jgi:hypothetical protein
VGAVVVQVCASVATASPEAHVPGGWCHLEVPSARGTVGPSFVCPVEEQGDPEEYARLLALFEQGTRRSPHQFQITRIEAVYHSGWCQAFDLQTDLARKRLHHPGSAFAGSAPNISLQPRLQPNLVHEDPTVLLAWHGCTHEAADQILVTGAANLKRGQRAHDAGFFGAGFYLALQAEYACMYSTGLLDPSVTDPASRLNERGEGVVLLCHVLAPDPELVSRETDYTSAGRCKFTGEAMSTGSSRLATVSEAHGFHVPPLLGTPPDYDEVVVAESAQVS